MKRLLFFIYGLLCFVYAQAQMTGTVQTDKLMAITNADVNMGRIVAGKPLEYTVIVKNLSRDTLELRDVKVGCGCTTPKYRAGERIAPGRSATIVLGFNGDAHGDFIKTADLNFAGGITRQVKFHGTTYSDSAAAPKVLMNR
jgi:hypothetical protein